MIPVEQCHLLPVPAGPLQVSRLPCQQWIGFDSANSDVNPSLVPPLHFSLVVPTYNESGNLEKIVSQLSSLLDVVLPGNYELIIVDDNSPDHTWAVARALIPAYPNLCVMRRQRERGLSTAVIRGWQVARGEVLGVIDADLQHPPDVLLKLLAEIDHGADLAVASRHVEGGGVSEWSATRRFLSRGAQLVGLILLPGVVGRVSDPMSGYFMVRRRAIAGQLLSPLGYKILLEVLGRGSIGQIAEVGYVFQEREEGQSKVSWQQYTDYLLHLLRLRLSTGRVGRLRQRFDFPLGRFFRFVAVGCSGLIVDMGMLYLLFDGLGLGLTRSAILAAELAIINNFFWNDRWTFRDLADQQRQGHQVLKRLMKFNLVCLMGLILKILLLNVFFNWLQLNPYLANFLAIAAVTLWNFWANLKLNWRVTQVK